MSAANIIVPHREPVVETLIDRCRGDLAKPSSWYEWPVNRNRLPPGIDLPPPGSSSYEENVALKYALHKAYLSGDESRKLELTEYYIAEWGGIKANREERLHRYAFSDDETLLALGTRGIASWSKALCIRDPDKWAIFDARVSAALNSIQLLGDLSRPIFFPLLPSRNRSIADGMDGIRDYARRAGWQRMDGSSLYRCYVGILTAAAEQLNQKTCTIEMWLFAKAECLLAQGNEKIRRE